MALHAMELKPEGHAVVVAGSCWAWCCYEMSCTVMSLFTRVNNRRRFISATKCASLSSVWPEEISSRRHKSIRGRQSSQLISFRAQSFTQFNHHLALIMIIAVIQ